MVSWKIGPRSRAIIDRDKKITSPSYTRDYPVVIAKGKGCWVYTPEGQKYLDFAAGIAVMALGHSHPAVVQAIKRQAGLATHIAFPDYYAEAPVRFLETLFSCVPQTHNEAFFTNSGTESNEAAIKLAKWHSRKPWIIAFDKCFHGRTMGSLSMTNSKVVQREGFAPFLPVRHVPFPNPYRSLFKDDQQLIDHSLQKIIEAIGQTGGQVAALFAEPIQGEGGYIVPPKGFWREVQKVCEEHDVLFVADEVQTGVWRTGTFWAMEGFGVQPDIVTMAKAVGGGLPLGVMIAHQKLMKWPPGSHSNTFGGNLLACAAGQATLEYLKTHRIGEHVKKMHEQFFTELRALQARSPYIGDIRGRGLMIGIEFVKDKTSKKPNPELRDRVLQRAAQAGLLLLGAGESSIRFCPPLIITKDEAHKGMQIFSEAVKKA